MNFHRLRVISFSHLLSKKYSSKNIKDMKVDKEEVSKAVQKQDMKENTTDSMISSSISMEPMPVRPLLEFKSKSETFKIPSKTLKYRTSRKTLSLNDIKKRFSIINMKYYNRIKQKSLLLRSGEQKKNIINKHEIKVLYVTNTSKFRNRRRSSIHNRKSDGSRSRSSCDLLSFYRNKRLFDPYTFYHRYTKDGNPFQKLRQRSERKRKTLREACTNCPHTHHALKVVSSGKVKWSPDKTHICTNPLHYNVLRFPHSSKSKLRQKNIRLYRTESMSNVKIERRHSAKKKKPCVTRKVSRGQSVSDSRLKDPVVYIDMAVSTCKSLKLPTNSISCRNPTSSESCEIKKSSSNGRKARRRCIRSNRQLIFSKIFRKILPCICDAYLKRRPTARKIVKHILLGLIILTWTPCIIAVGIGWLLTYPLRPQNIVSANNRQNYKVCNEGCYFDQCQYNYWTAFMGLTRRVAKATYASGKTIFSLTRSKEQLEPEELTNRRSHPDPGKKYTLFHADGRGWVIKPVRSNPHQKQNRFKQVFHNMFCDCDHTNMHKHSSRTRHRPTAAPNTSFSYAAKESTNDPYQSVDTNKHAVSGNESGTKHEAKICLFPSEPSIKEKQEVTFKPCGRPENIYKAKEIANTTSGSHQKYESSKQPHEFSKEAKPADTKIISCSCPSSCHTHAQISTKEPCQITKVAKLDTKVTSCICPIHKTNKQHCTDAKITSCSCPVHRTTKQPCEPYSKKKAKSADAKVTTCTCPTYRPTVQPCQSKKEIKSADAKVSSCICPSHRPTRQPSKCTREKQSISNNVASCVCPTHGPTKQSSQSAKEGKSADTKVTSCSCPKHRSEPICIIRQTIPKKSMHSCDVPEKTKYTRPFPLKDMIKKSVYHPKLTCTSKVQIPSNKSICSVRMEPKRSRSAIDVCRPDPELVYPPRVRSQSMSKEKKCPVKRSRTSKLGKTERIAITECGPITCKQGDPGNVDAAVSKVKDRPAKRRSLKPGKTKTKDEHSPSAIRRKLGERRNKSKARHRPTESREKNHDGSPTAKTEPQTKPSSSKEQKEQPRGNVRKVFLKKKKLEKELSCGQRFWGWLRSLRHRTAESVDRFDENFYNSTFPAEVRCGHLYIQTLRSRPCFWIYKCWPSMYPWFLRWFYCSKTCCYHCTFSISFCFWAPLAACCYISYKILSCCCQ